MKSKQEIVFRGRIFEVEHLHQPDGRAFEVARRAPGVRLIISKKEERQLLLTREFRRELDDWDYRLPGGKVFDTLKEYDDFREAGKDVLLPAAAKAKAEGAEEAGIDVKDLKFFKKSTLGATVEWDLYVFEVTDWQEHVDGQQLEQGEQVEADNWFGYDEVKKMILEGHMQEERIALILLQWLSKQDAS